MSDLAGQALPSNVRSRESRCVRMIASAKIRLRTGRGPVRHASSKSSTSVRELLAKSNGIQRGRDGLCCRGRWYRLASEGPAGLAETCGDGPVAVWVAPPLGFLRLGILPHWALPPVQTDLDETLSLLCHKIFVQELNQRPLISGHDEEHTGEGLRLHDLTSSLGVPISRAHGPRALFKDLVPRGARSRMVEQALSLLPLLLNCSLVVLAP